MYYDTSQICYLGEKDRICSKLGYSGLDKHISLKTHTHSLSTEFMYKKSVMFYSTGRIHNVSFSPLLMNWPIKLYCLSMTSLSSPVYCNTLAYL
jgi:hypothetical protein